jgi:hypothetical protein
MFPRHITLPAAAALVLALAGCGGDSGSSSTVQASGSSSHSMDGMHGMEGMGAATTEGGAPRTAPVETMRMDKLGEATQGDETVELDGMAPVTFAVSEGTRLITHKPTAQDTAHLMVVLSDALTRDRLPDATITARIADGSGKVVYEGPQYPMIGMGMGLHYGDNVTLPGAGHYVATLVVGPPAIGRHADSTKRWNVTRRFSIPFDWTPEP